MTGKAWTERRREVASRVARAHWDVLSEAEQQARMDRGREEYFARYPERKTAFEDLRAAIAAGDIRPAVCEHCGKTGAPGWGHTTGQQSELLGWRCYDCRTWIPEGDLKDARERFNAR